MTVIFAKGIALVNETTIASLQLHPLVTTCGLKNNFAYKIIVLRSNSIIEVIIVLIYNRMLTYLYRKRPPKVLKRSTVVYVLDIKWSIELPLRFVFYGFEQLLQDKGILFLKGQSGLRPLLCYIGIIFLYTNVNRPSQKT